MYLFHVPLIIYHHIFIHTIEILINIAIKRNNIAFENLLYQLMIYNFVAIHLMYISFRTAVKQNKSKFHVEY